MKKFIYLLFIMSLLAGSLCPVYGAGTSGTISNTFLYDYSQPPSFQPSLNSHFTALSDSATTVLANPAGILRVNTIEAAVGFSGLSANPIKNVSDNFYLDDQVMDGEDLNGATAGITMRFTADRTVSTPAARAIALNDQYSKGGGINYFGLTFRVADNLAFAFSRQRPTALNIAMDASIPQMTDITLDMRGFEELDVDGNGFRITTDGYIQAVENNTVISTSSAAVYNGFLDQSTKEVNWINMSVNNTVVNQQSVVITTAFKTGPVDWGINIVPITYNINLDNNISMVSDTNNGSMEFMIPDLFNDPTSTEVIDWATSLATTSAGYIGKAITTHPSSTSEIAGVVAAGQYSGSALRLDLGAIWEPNDYMSFAFNFENLNGAKLYLAGSNVVSYAQHWVDQNSEMPTPEGVTWDPFLSSPTHEVDAEKYIMLGSTLPTIVLPSKLTFGFALKKPIVLAVDFEQWQSQMGINTDPGSPEAGAIATLSNLTFLKVGSEMQVLFLPIMMRGRLTMLMKPSTDDPDLQTSLDEMFSQLPILPIEGDIYFSGKAWGGELGVGFGGGGLALTRTLAADMSNIAKIYFTDIYYATKVWRVSYQMTMDPILTGFDSDFNGGNVSLASTSTLSVGFKF